MEKQTTIRGVTGIKVNTILSGNMYYFKYIAEPTNIYYDRWPLVFIIKKRGRLLEGINFHYLDVKFRKVIFENIKPFLSLNEDDKIDNDSRIFVKKYRNMVYNVKSFRFAKSILHRYRTENIRSQIIMIQPNNWASTIITTSENFVMSQGGIKNSQKVFRETLIKSRHKRTK